MKLRNKKTGEVIEADYISVARSGFDVVDKDGNIIAKDIHTLPLCYSSVRELTSEFEDYTPAEPLIKDEKVCNLIRAWADFINDNELTIRVDKEKDDTFCDYTFIVNKHLFMRFFMRRVDGLESGDYTIAELCGEEEE